MTKSKHREEEGELVRAWVLISNPHHLIDHKDNLTERITSALSSRDQEIREVLEGLRGKGGCWCRDGNPLGLLDHDSACLAARVLWDKVQTILTVMFHFLRH